MSPSPTASTTNDTPPNGLTSPVEPVAEPEVPDQTLPEYQFFVLRPKDVELLWKTAEPLIAQAAMARREPEGLRVLYGRLMTGELDLWVAIDKGRTIVGVVLTRVGEDFTNTDLILWITGMFAPKLPLPMFEYAWQRLLAFGKEHHCKSIDGFTNNDVVLEMVKRLGGQDRIYVSVPLEDK